jgi:hypothetical protein
MLPQNLTRYSLFLLINFVFILFTVRVFYFALIAKHDPIKSIIPNIKGWSKFEIDKDLEQHIETNS